MPLKRSHPSSSLVSSHYPKQSYLYRFDDMQDKLDDLWFSLIYPPWVSRRRALHITCFVRTPNWTNKIFLLILSLYLDFSHFNLLKQNRPFFISPSLDFFGYWTIIYCNKNSTLPFLHYFQQPLRSPHHHQTLKLWPPTKYRKLDVNYKTKFTKKCKSSDSFMTCKQEKVRCFQTKWNF